MYPSRASLKLQLHTDTERVCSGRAELLPGQLVLMQKRTRWHKRATASVSVCVMYAQHPPPLLFCPLSYSFLSLKFINDRLSWVELHVIPKGEDMWLIQEQTVCIIMIICVRLKKKTKNTTVSLWSVFQNICEAEVKQDNEGNKEVYYGGANMF